MATTSFIGLVLMGMLGLFVGTSDAIRCYSCSSCGNTIGNLISCSNEYSQCAEVRSQQLFSISYDRYCVGQCPSYSGSAVQIKCCQTDACNGAESSLVASFVGLFLALLVSPLIRLVVRA